MNDNEIIRALECCLIVDSKCTDCPFSFERHYCRNALLKHTLDLINRLQVDNERLQGVIDSFTDIGKLYSEIKSEARKEFAERLCEGRVSNDPVVIAVKVELEMMDGKKEGEK